MANKGNSMSASQGKLTVAQKDNLLSRFGTKLVNIAALRGDVLQAIPPSQRQIGKDYVPPMAALSIIDPQKVSMGHAQKLQATQLPKSFSWRNAEDIKKAGKGKMMMGPVRNQLTCGSCWAVAAATALSNRWSIATQTPIDLSETYLMSCMTEGTSQQCNGGLPVDAGQFFEESGTVSRDCYPYTWCENSEGCNAQGSGEAAGENNSLIPACGDKCLACPDGGPNCKPSEAEFKIYKAKKGTTKQLVTIEDIKADLFTFGPLTGSYCVFSDFLTEGANNFSKTAGVYINRQNKDSPYGDNDAAKQIMGFHAVTIIGWGQKQVPDFGTVPYWEVLNSWGPEFGDNGVWLHAMSDAEKDININVGMDIPAEFDVGNGQKQKLGGATSFLPDTEYVATQGGNNNGDNSNGGNGNNDGNSPGPSSGGSWVSPKSVIGYIMIACLLVLIVLMMAYVTTCA